MTKLVLTVYSLSCNTIIYTDLFHTALLWLLYSFYRIGYYTPSVVYKTGASVTYTDLLQ